MPPLPAPGSPGGTAPTLQAGNTSSKAAAELARQVEERRARLEFKERGVDVCIMMDCTGSMVGAAGWAGVGWGWLAAWVGLLGGRMRV
jgi:hypothetical protein